MNGHPGRRLLHRIARWTLARRKVAFFLGALGRIAGIHIRIVPIRGVLGGSEGVLEPAGEAICEPNRTPSGIVPLTASIRTFPDIEFRVVRDAIITPRCVGVLTDDGAFIRRPVWPTDLDHGGWNIPNHRADDGDLALSAWRRTLRIDSAIFLGGMWSNNYYHWMMEHLPLLWLAQRLPGSLRDLPVVVNSDAVRVPAIRESLDLLLDGRRLIALPPRATLQSRELVLIDCPKMLVDFREGGRFESGVEALHRSAMQSYTEGLMERLGVRGTRSEPDRSIMVIRPKGAPRPFNQEAVLDHLRPMGFEAVDPSSLSLRDQARLFRSGATFAGPAGAAMTNIMFARPDARFVIWGHPSSIRSLWPNIAALSGAHVVQLEVGAATSGAQNGSDWSIDPDRVAMAVMGLRG